MGEYAVYIPVGPDERDPARVTDLIDGLACFEPETSWIVIVADAWDGNSLERMLAAPSGCRLTVLPHPRTSRHYDKLGAVCTSDLIAYEFIDRHCRSDFILKMDTDALIIAPFVEKIRRRFSEQSEIGMLGVLGNTCNRQRRTFQSDDNFMRILRHAVGIARQLIADRNGLSDDMTERLKMWGIVTERKVDNFIAACRHLLPLIERGFKGSHCQGGAYAVSGEMLSRMSARGFFEDPQIWTEIPFPEDKLMGAFCFLVGLKAIDYSEPGEPFGIQSFGIAHPPEVLHQLGYSLIHSVKNDPQYDEEFIREYFRSHRKPAVRRQ